MKRQINYFKNSAILPALIITFGIFYCTLHRTVKKDNHDQYVVDGDLIFMNTTKDVKYTGDESCRPCHMQIYDAFKKSPTGRSMSIMDSTNIIETFPQKEAVYDSSRNYYYEMVEKNGKYYQREFRLDKNGDILHELRMEAQYVIGSGTNLRMYFYDENGMFYQLPLTWYVHERKWDMSPGYSEFYNARFSRYVGQMCFSCHNGHMTPLETAYNRYDKPYKIGIACEDCHGPGDLHVRQCQGEKIKLPSKNALTIVNPPKLSPKRRNDVCMQCHFEGKAWALQENMGWFDFRPGMLLSEHRSVYSPETKKINTFTVANSGLRLSQSRCYKNSHGNMACDLCHDSHGMLQVEKIRFNRQNCLRCHPIEGLPKRESRFHESRENCIRCHMNQTGKTNTLHGVVNTDHWIRINADQDIIDWHGERTDADQLPLFKLAADLDSDDNLSSIRRGIAYADMYWGEHNTRFAYLDSAKKYLYKGLKINDSHARGHYYYGRVFFEFKNYDKAIQHLNRSLELDPDFPDTYYRLAHVYRKKKQFDQAIDYYRKALLFKPEEPTYLESLGSTLHEADQIDEAVQILEQALSIDRQNPYVHYILGNIQIFKLKNPFKALEYYKSVVQLDPDFPNGYINLGNTYVSLGQYDNAIATYNKEIATRPQSGRAYLNLAHVYQLQGNLNKAQQALTKATTIDPELMQMHEKTTN